MKLPAIDVEVSANVARAWILHAAALGLAASGCGAPAPAAPRPAVVTLAANGALPKPPAPSTGVFEAPLDTGADDPALPPGTVAVRVADADDAPLRLAPVTLESAILPVRGDALDVTAKGLVAVEAVMLVPRIAASAHLDT
ncbi:MAG TPA: hypothetical protein VHB21_19830 [Minicystis sp.]|nr:hypothetical protein [Minicystis sp.]